MLSHKKHLLAAAALATLLAGCQNTLGYELFQAAKPSDAPTSAHEVEAMMPVIGEMSALPSKAELAKRKIRPRKWAHTPPTPMEK